MEFGIASTNLNSYNRIPDRGASDVQVIVKVAHDELRRLVQQRAEITHRIGTIKRTIAGLCSLFGDHELSDDLRKFVDRKSAVRRPGITQACRKALKDSGCPLTARNVCELVQRQTRPGMPCSNNLLNSVTTILARLVQYGEARTVPRDDGPRTWVWVSRVADADVHPASSVVDSHVQE
jgi:hypothetical protein